MKSKYTRDELIQICKDAVVHHTKWGNRDSYCAQVTVASVYEGLTAGFPFTIDESSTADTIWITFDSEGEFEAAEGKFLDISDRSQYFEDCDPDRETEMFHSNPADFTELPVTCYIPTRSRLENSGGEDWY